MANIILTYGAGGTYATLIDAWNAVPTDVVATGNTYQLAQTSAELVVTTTTTLSGKTTGPNNRITIQPTGSNSFLANANVLTNPYRYNASAGAAMRCTASAVDVIQINNSYVTLRGMQVSSNVPSNGFGSAKTVTVASGTDGVIVDKNIIYGNDRSGFVFPLSVSGANGQYTNNLVILDFWAGSVVYVDTGSALFENNTLVRPAAWTVTNSPLDAVQDGVTGSTYRNNAALGCSQFLRNGAGASTGINNASAPGTVGFGTGNQDSLAFASQVVDDGTSTAGDYRIKTGSALINAGATTSTGNTVAPSGARSQGSAPDIGAWELVPAAASAVVITGASSITAGYSASLRIATDNPLTAGQSQVVALSDSAGGSFIPASVNLSDTAGFQFSTYSPTATLGARTVTASATGTPTLTSATKSITVAAPVPASTLTLSGAGTSVVGTAISLTVSTDTPMRSTDTETVTFSDGAGGTFAPATVTLDQAHLSLTVQYTPIATGAHTITASATGTPTVSNATLANTASPAPPTFGAGNNVYEIGIGHQFTTVAQFATFINAKNLVASQASVTALDFSSETVANVTINPVANATYFVDLIAAPGFGYRDVATTGIYDYPNAGVELTIHGLSLGYGVNVRNFRLKFDDASRLTSYESGFGATLDGNRVLITNATAVYPLGANGGYAKLNLRNNVFIRTAGSYGFVDCQDSRGDIVGNTFITRGGATGNGALHYNIYVDTAVVIQNNVFVDCGGSPMVYDGSGTPFSTANYKNNYSNVTSTMTAQMVAGFTIETVAAFVTNKASDLRPASGGFLLGKGNTLVVSTNDGAGKNRGLTPDAGAFQLVPAVALPTGAVTSQPAPTGQALTITFSTTNTPTAATASLSPDASTGNTGLANTGTVTLGTNTGSVTFSNIVPGSYTPVINLSNTGGPGVVSGLQSVLVNGIAGSPEAPLTQSQGPSTVSGVVLYPSTVNVAGGSTQQFAASVIGTGSPSQAVTWSKTGPGTLSSTGLYTAPATTTDAQTAIITATSTQDGTKSGTATVTVPAVAPTVTSVTIAPLSLVIAGDGTQQFTATIAGTGGPSQAVTWSKSGPGTLSSTGLFAAPSATTSVQLTTITATSVQDPTKASSVIATVAAVVLAPTVSAVVVNPLTAVVAAGATRQFGASVLGTNNPSQFVTWSKSGPGTLSADGLFTAPAASGNVQTSTIIATSITDSTKSGSAIATVPAIILPGVAPNVPPSRILVVGPGDGRFDPTVQNFRTEYTNRGRVAAISKDPQARLGYGMDLAPWLTDLGITLASAKVTLFAGVTIDGGDVFVSGSQVLFWVKGGILPLSTDAFVENYITVHFTGSDGSEDERTIQFMIEDR